MKSLVFTVTRRPMYKDEWIRTTAGKPEFVIVSVGPAVKRVSINMEDFSAEAK